MKQTTLIIVLLAILAGINSHGKDNLLNNPGFEKTGGNQKRIWIKGWDFGNPFDADAVSLAAKEKYSGQKSLKFSGEKKTAKLSHFPATSDSDYLLEFKTKSVDMPKNVLKLELFAHPGKKPLLPDGKFEDGGNHNWRKHEFRINKSKLPEKLKSIYLRMEYRGGSGGGIYLDDFKLVNLNTGKNIIVNPSFEGLHKVYDIVQRNPEWHTEEWAYLNIPPQNSVIDDSHAHAGKKSLMLEGGKNVILITSGIKPVEKNKKYKLTGWIKSAGLNRGTVEFRLWRKKKTGWKMIKSNVNPVVFCGTKDWHEIESFLAVPENADYDGISVRIYLPCNNTGMAWLDDFSLTKVEKIAAGKFGNYLINAAFDHYDKTKVPFWWSPLEFPQTRFKNWKTEYFAVDEREKSPVPEAKALKIKYPDETGKPITVITNCIPAVIPSGTYTFSVYLKADKDNFDVEYYDYSLNKKKKFNVSRKWKRFTYSSNRNKRKKFLNHFNCWLSLKQPGTLWMCAPQFEAGTKATPFKKSKLDSIMSMANSRSEMQTAQIPEVSCPKLKGKPVLDGKLDDDFWKQAKPLGAFKTTDTAGELKVAGTKVWLARNSDNLYLGIACSSPGLEKVKIKPSDSPWKSDVAEVFISPDAAASKYYHFVCNPVGTTYSETGCNGEGTFNVPWTAKVSAGPDNWTCEFEIPFSSLPFYKNSDVWRLNVCRFRRIPGTVKNEISSWSRVFNGFHSPLHFGKITGMKSDDVSERGWRIDNLKLSAGGKAKNLSLWISGAICGISKIKTEITYNGKTYPGKLSGRIMKSARNGKFVFTGLPNNINQGNPELSITDSSDKILKKITLDFIKNPQGFDADRITVFPEYSLYSSENHARIIADNPLNKKLKMHVVVKSGHSGVVSEKNLTFSGKGKKSLDINIGNLPAGKYAISLYNKSDNSLVASSTLQKVSPAKNMSRYNRERRYMEVNGKPFFPVQYYGMPTEDWAFAELKAKGYNVISVFAIPGLSRFAPRSKGWREKTGKYLDLLHKKGFKAILWISGLSFYNRMFGSKKVPFATYRDKVIEPVRSFKNHPAIIGWWIEDEQSKNSWHNHRGFKETDLLKLYEAIKEVDPYHLAWNNLHGSQISRSSEPYGTLNCTDIISVDYYPYRWVSFPLSSQPLGLFADIASYLEYNACIAHKPSIYAYQVYGVWDAARFPTMEECVAQHFIALVYGAIPMQYTRRPVSNELFDVMGKLNLQSKKLFNELFSNPEVENIEKGTRTGTIHYSVWRKENEYHLIAVNSAYVKTGFSINLKPLCIEKHKTGKPALVNRKDIEVKDFILSDDFKPLEAKIFIFRISR